MSNEQNNQVEHVEVAAVEVNAIEMMERASVDIQIATAHRYPRDIDTFIEKAKKMVSVDEETAESCIYRRPVGKDDDAEGQKFVEGESIRLAEIVAANYGNLRVGVIISEMNPRYVKAIGFAHDLESNVANKAEVVESTVTKHGRPYSERMRLVVAKAAQSKARRDAIFSVVPKSLCKPIIETARHIIAGHQRPLAKRQEAVKIWMSKLSIEPERVFAALNVEGVHEMGDKELETLTGIRTALRDGDITIDEAFPLLSFQQEQKETDKKIEAEMGSESVNVPEGEEAQRLAAEGKAIAKDLQDETPDPDTKARAAEEKAKLQGEPKMNQFKCLGKCKTEFVEPGQKKGPKGSGPIFCCPNCGSLRIEALEPGQKVA